MFNFEPQHMKSPLSHFSRNFHNGCTTTQLQVLPPPLQSPPSISPPSRATGKPSRSSSLRLVKNMDSSSSSTMESLRILFQELKKKPAHSSRCPPLKSSPPTLKTLVPSTPPLVSATASETSAAAVTWERLNIFFFLLDLPLFLNSLSPSPKAHQTSGLIFLSQKYVMYF